MKDMVTNGTGNSRYLKTALPSGTSWEDALAMLRAGTFPVDFAGLNSGGIAQQGSAYNKANVLPQDVCTALGLTESTAEPKDAFTVLSNPADLWMWEKWNSAKTSFLGYVTSPSSSAYPANGTSGGYYYIQLGKIGERARVQAGSYVGTGVKPTADAPMSLTFSFKPKIVMMTLTESVPQQPYTWAFELTDQYSASTDDGIVWVASGNYYIYAKVVGNTLYWYSGGSSASYGFNGSGTTYHYIAIG